MTRLLKNLFSVLAALLVAVPQAALADDKAPPFWAYDPGPDVNDPMGKELVDLWAGIPDFAAVSMRIMGEQKFRPHYGPVGWRMRLQPNSVKILFIGQDATHIAEAAGRTATAGFGGRAQDLANYFGVDHGAGFINTYAFTIQGQYGSFNAPYVAYDPAGKASVRLSGFVDNRLWLMTHDQESPVARFRNSQIDWIIRNNKQSLKMIVLFGGAARDAIATFIESKGGKVGARMPENTMKSIQVPEMKLVEAGGNNEFPVPLTKAGGDIYEKLLGTAPNYTTPAGQEQAAAVLKTKIDEAVKELVFTKGGPYGNGILHPAQLGGFSLDRIAIDGKTTRSLKGLPLADGSRVENDVLVLELPHPSALSRMTPADASERVAQALKALSPYVESGWKIQADEGFTNSFAAGESYLYARAKIGPVYYDFGAPASRMVPVSSASRLSGNPHVIVFGTRDRIRLDKDLLKAATEALPSSPHNEANLFTARPRALDSRYVFDRGPGEKLARIMRETLDLKAIYKAKEGMSWEANGIDAFNVKTHKDNGPFGHFRGKTEKPRVLILADPDGADDLITARALTGARGQYLNGLMHDLGVGDDYLVIKTVPFGMDGATRDEWNVVLQQTAKYRKQIFETVLAGHRPELVIADGEQAAREIEKLAPRTKIVKIARSGLANSSGLAEAAVEITKIPAFADALVKLGLRDIPRSHLTFYARVWEGTSGDRVLPATDKTRGMAFAEVAPQWAWSQKADPGLAVSTSIEKILKKLSENRLPLPAASGQ